MELDTTVQLAQDPSRLPVAFLPELLVPQGRTPPGLATSCCLIASSVMRAVIVGLQQVPGSQESATLDTGVG